MKLKVESSIPNLVETQSLDALSEALSDLPVKILRSARGRIVLDLGEDYGLRSMVLERLQKKGFSSEEVKEFTVKPALEGSLTARFKNGQE
jgi:hypothetical protein